MGALEHGLAPSLVLVGFRCVALWHQLTSCLSARRHCRQLRIGEGAKKTRTRKQWKDLKKKKRTTWGTGKRAANRAAKKAAAS